MASKDLSAGTGTLPEWRAVGRIAAPLIAGNLVQMMLTTTDVLLVGRIGGAALASAALAASFYQAVSIFCGGLVMATTPLIAAALGRGRDLPEIRLLIACGLWTSLLAGGAAWFVLGQTEAILLALGQSAALAAGAAEMMSVLRWAIFPYLVYVLLRGVLAATDKAGWTLLVVVSAVIFNALAGWALILGNMGAPSLGLFGAGIANLVASIILAMGTLLVTWRHPALRSLQLLAVPFRLPVERMAALWRLGLPIAIALACEMGIFYAAMLMAGVIGPDVLAAHAVAMQITSVCFMLPFGFGQAATVRVGFAFGARDVALARRTAWIAFRLGMACVLLTGVITGLFPRAFLALFLDADALHLSGEAGTAMLRIAALFLFASAAQTILAGALRGLQDTRTAMWIAALGYWGIGLPAALFLGFRIGLGGPGVWLGLTVGLVAVAVMMLWRWRYCLARFADQAA